MTAALYFLSTYLVVIGYITWKSSRKESNDEYMNSGKRLSAWESAWTTFASLLTGYNFVLGVTFSYLYGIWYLMAFVGGGAAFVALYFLFKKKLSELQSGHNLFSIGDYFGIEYGKSTKVIVNGILCLSLFLFLVLQIFVNTGLFSNLLGVNKLTAILLTTGIVCIYLWFGGFKTSVKTDIFQGFLMLPIILAIFAFPFHITWQKLPMVFDSSQIGFAVGLALLQFFSLFAQAESFQRVFASKDAVSLKKGLYGAFGLLVLVAGSIAYLGINFKFSGVISDPSNLFVTDVLSALPSWLSSLFAVSLIAAFMGTIDSSAFALGVLLTTTRGIFSTSTIKQTRYLIVGSIILASLASWYLFSFLSAVFALISLVSVIGALTLISLIWKINRMEANTFLVTSLIVYILGLSFRFITDNPLTSLIPCVAGLISFIVLRVYCLVSKQ